MKTVIKYLISLIFAIIIVLFIQTFLIRGAIVTDDNMSPTLVKGDRLIVNKIKVTFNLLDTGDIIMYNIDGHTHFGRIIGEPGQSIEIRNNKIYHDDREVKDKFAKNRQLKNFSLRDMKYSDGDIISPKQYFVLNDNDHYQSDSRRYGLIDKKNIIGDISIKYYPFEAFTTDFK
ncbi:signal peptidase I [Staphylococcus warneri]|uniref:signal peptidase I n=1 Tax=Staphylococcus warneri TaxID=1292 RepID=UPI002541EB28|nr:signal peptidase I [Staphylococcus warneri]MDK4212806.1 signal peptidase I [Staphylococcus warneri]